MEKEEIKMDGFQIKSSNKLTFQFLPDDFVSLLIGKPGSGKSHLIQELLYNQKLYKKHFNYVFIFSPREIDGLQCKLNNNFFNKFSIDKIYEIIEKYKKSKRILFVIDDFINEIKKAQHDPRIQALFYNRRHLLEKDGNEISFIITTQKYMQFPFTLRTCITKLFIFDINKKELNQINNDIGIIDLKQLQQIMQLVKQKEHGFLMILLQNLQLYLNFDQIII